MHRSWNRSIMGLAMACSNTFGLVTGAFLLGFGLSEIPKSIWKNADWNNRQKILSYKVAKMAVKLDDAHQEFSNAIVIAQATSKQMSKRDPLRPYMDVVDNMLVQMLKEDPSFKPAGGRLGENDMDYDTNEKTMATLRRQLKKAHEEYYRCKSEYMAYVMEALELEDTIKNYQHCDSTRWKYISSFRGSRTGALGSFVDTLEFLWRCFLKNRVKKCAAVLLGCMTVAILLAEATILPSGVDLSLFSILINTVGKQEMLVQIAAFVPLMYMCICTYYSLFKIGMLMFYSLTPRQTSSVSLLMICSMVARYAPPISYNFLNLIRLDRDNKTVFEKRMGNIDDAVPFFGQGFNRIYPLIMVIYTVLVAVNFFGRVIDYFGSWKRFRFRNEEEDMNGFDQSGIIILQKERSWLEKGYNVGEQVIPLARNFGNFSVDLESGNVSLDKDATEVDPFKEEGRKTLKSQRKDNQIHGTIREALADKSATRQSETSKKALSLSSVSSLDPLYSHNQPDINPIASGSGLSTKWASIKSGFQKFKTNIGAKKFLPLREIQETSPGAHSISSSESLDKIFQRLKQRPSEYQNNEYDSDDGDA
ncbi:LMBR1 domain-containing protein 2 homolog A-like isoform X2 [Phalaenopsis equestris]|nr:LMBR1 domain-containing protein 2 homolog A-like isoform X2 [Phalaenopsis equestris]